jgi:Catalytic LigB subunit of aromatic ring-opening dioxygenase
MLLVILQPQLRNHAGEQLRGAHGVFAARAVAPVTYVQGTPSTTSKRDGGCAYRARSVSKSLAHQQISLRRDASLADHEQIGKALCEFREDNVLIIGSGSITHNLSAIQGAPIDAAAAAWVSDFSQWMQVQLQTNARAALLDYRVKAPFVARNHPTEVHLLPLYVAMDAYAVT